ncbi:response regulator [Oxalobacteraceae bacterium R-40]|uniref:Response regulator n=1 Tax=Keguizhuia sedimenti TaxID=3064264 RepID=A0ABU1BPA3_9BURK|nr:response regulator [Oxalobacteraceae bacterium R-40]
MIFESKTKISIALIGVSKHERTVLTSLFKISGIYQEWKEDSSTPASCVLLDSDDPEGRLWYDAEMQRPSGIPIVTIGSFYLGNNVAAHLLRPFRWGQALEALKQAIEQSSRRELIPQHALSTTFCAVSDTMDAAISTQLRVYRTQAAALVINPNPKGWRYITAELGQRGYRVDHVSTSAAAVLLLANFRYNLVFVEAHLPDEDGIAICKLLKQSQARRRTTAIILSTDRKAVDRIRGTFSGCDVFISKPVDPDELQRVLDKLAPEYVLDESCHSS